MIRSSKSSNTVAAVLSMAMAAFAAVPAQAQSADINVPTVIINSLWSAKALWVSGGQGSGCYPVNNGGRVAGPTLRTNIRYTVIGMSSADCAGGTGLAGVNRQFLARARPAGMYIQIVNGGINVGNR
ncbi:hypothetical protein HEP73_01453 [Xanthomonas sp. GW]|uniref:hypothetical protein n=1 Tax=Xanthomonas sp. GW TaxID=2724121 RepID=UPI00163AE2E4|nr:hypothetical protein [Xanthomonas sp. GW]QNH20553.1 hypothetical protein HEP73_01453 [Xanthomonas sp. GW]